MEFYAVNDGHHRDGGGVGRVRGARRGLTLLRFYDVLACLLAREDDYSGLPEVTVPTDVIPMPMRVHQISYGLWRNMGHSSDDLVVKLRPFGIHQEYALIAGQHPDVTAETLQHVHAVSEVAILDGRLIPIGQRKFLARPAHRCRGQQAAASYDQRSRESLHVAIPRSPA